MYQKLLLRTGLLLVLCLAAEASKLQQANVMAPLDLDQDPNHSADAWNAFKAQLSVASAIGVDAVAVDIWWGKVEAHGDNVFDWSYYDRIEKAIEDAHLHWVPVMSFHQCGGNVGDVCSISIPPWIWTRYQGQGISKPVMQYRSEHDNTSPEVVALWEDRFVIPQYQEFMIAFANHFAGKSGFTDEISLSAGPAGELRYPSYDAHDGGACGFPTRGCFQSYSDPARADFRAYILRKYENLAGVNNAWKDSLSSSPLTDSSQIGPPDNGDPVGGRAAFFIAHRDHFNTQYGRDFIDWYNQALVDHGRRMLDAAITAFSSGAFENTPLGIKMAGVHWQMMDNADYPRAAEISAGLIQTSIPNLKDEGAAFGYQNILNMLGSYLNHVQVNFHFTCLEKDDMEWDGGSHAFSLAKTLVFWVSKGAAHRGLTIRGENALEGGAEDNHGWDNIWNAFHWAAYSGLTVLRVDALTESSGVAKARYQDFIRYCKMNCSPNSP